MAWRSLCAWTFKTNPMKKAFICLSSCILFAGTSLLAQDNAKPAADTTRSTVDTARQTADTLAAPGAVISHDTVQVTPHDSAAVVTPAADDAAKKDSAAKADAPAGASPTAPAVAVATVPATAATAQKDSAQKARDTTTDEERIQLHQLDKRWFISPLLKLQFQDFAMLEKNRKGY